MKGGNDRTIENGLVYDEPLTAVMGPSDKFIYGMKPLYKI
jgi:hypothetical protein